MKTDMLLLQTFKDYQFSKRLSGELVRLAECLFKPFERLKIAESIKSLCEMTSLKSL